MDIETLKKDLIANSKIYDQLVFQRNDLNLQIFRLEGVIGYIKKLIESEEQKILATKKTKEEVKTKEVKK